MEITVDSRDSYTFKTCCWFLFELLAPQARTQALAIVTNPRDSRPRRSLSLQACGEGVVSWAGSDIRFSVAARGFVTDDGRPDVHRTLSLTGDQETLEAFVHEALDRRRTFSQSGPVEAVNQWVWDCESWERGKPRSRRPMSSLFLSADAEGVVQDYRRFLGGKGVYDALHVCPSRIYLLHGVPGSGKSSLVHCLASETGCGVATLSFGPNVTDADLREAMHTLPSGCVLCIEDIDCVISPDRKTSSVGLTFSGVLAAFDGCVTEEPVAVFLTTNHLDVLDPAVRRRVDVAVQFGWATRAQAKRMFDHFAPHLGSPDFDRFWDMARGTSFSMATLQKFLMKAVLGDGESLYDARAFREMLAVAGASRDQSLYS